MWSRVTDEFELDVRELLVLEVAARQADDVAALEGSLAEHGVIVPGSKGQPRVAGAVAEVRAGRAALVRLLGALDLPSELGEPSDAASAATPGMVSGMTSSQRTRRAQKAAEARWRGVAKVERGKGATGRGSA